MKKTLLKLAGGLFIVAAAAVTMFASQPQNPNYDLVMQNIEALTQDEEPPKINCIIQKNSKCIDQVKDALGTVYYVEYEDKIKA